MSLSEQLTGNPPPIDVVTAAEMMNFSRRFPRAIAITALSTLFVVVPSADAALRTPAFAGKCGIDIVQFDGTQKNDVDIIYVPGVTDDTTADGNAGKEHTSLQNSLRDRSEHFDRFILTGNRSCMQEQAKDIANLVDERKKSYGKVVIFAASYGGFLATIAANGINPSPDITFILADVPSGNSTLRASLLAKFANVWFPGPIADSFFTNTGLMREAFNLKDQHVDYSISQYRDQVADMNRGIPNTNALKNFPTYYIEGSPTEDDVVVQPNAAEDWAAAVPNLQIVGPTIGKHLAFASNPASYIDVFEQIPGLNTYTYQQP